MFTVDGQYNSATIYTDDIEPEAISQIIQFCNQPTFAESKIRIMPDVHAGAGCTVGTTMTIKDKVVPNIVGVDIGCGMLVAEFGKVDIDPIILDETIHKYVPAGFEIRETEHKFIEKIHINELLCNEIDSDRAYKSIGTLGGGNHFIELDTDDDGNKYLVIHSGSRRLGQEVAKYYQKTAFKDLSNKFGRNKRDAIIKRCKAENKKRDIEVELKELAKIRPENFNSDFAYCEGVLFDNYIHDMKIMQEFAVYNREAILDTICSNMGLTIVNKFCTLHNYIDMDAMILRKGAVSAQKDERLIIPMNMRDGSLICIGKGNPEWNYSAPHGAGRLLSRSKAKEQILLEDFEASMNGIYTTSISYATIDEAPMVYKPMQEIIDNIGDTVTIEKIIKPLYNFKAGD